jgi:hypothetical protein
MAFNSIRSPNSYFSQSYCLCILQVTVQCVRKVTQTALWNMSVCQKSLLYQKVKTMLQCKFCNVHHAQRYIHPPPTSCRTQTDQVWSNPVEQNFLVAWIARINVFISPNMRGFFFYIYSAKKTPRFQNEYHQKFSRDILYSSCNIRRIPVLQNPNQSHSI